MLRATVVTLVGENPGAHGVFETYTEVKRIVPCSVKSIGMKEAYQAMATGLNPELKIVLDHDFEYRGEKIAELEGITYRIVRTYVTETETIELTVQREAGNAEVTV